VTRIRGGMVWYGIEKQALGVLGYATSRSKDRPVHISRYSNYARQTEEWIAGQEGAGYAPPPAMGEGE